MEPELTDSYQIEVYVEENWPADEATLRRAALAALLYHGALPVEVAIVVSDDASLRELNQRYRDIDAPTDVLAFANETRGPFISMPGQLHYLGDVVISFPRAQEQAAAAGHGTMAELQLLVVHGILHLLGHDDQAEPQRTAMWAAQEAILRALDVEVNLPE